MNISLCLCIRLSATCIMIIRSDFCIVTTITECTDVTMCACISSV